MGHVFGQSPEKFLLLGGAGASMWLLGGEKKDGGDIGRRSRQLFFWLAGREIFSLSLPVMVGGAGQGDGSEIEAPIPRRWRGCGSVPGRFENEDAVGEVVRIGG